MLDSHTVDTRIPFVGRALELRHLLAFLKQGGALTLVGPGGVGKSRLALEAAHRFQSIVARRTAFVALAGIAPEAVVGTVMSSVGVREESGREPLATLTEALAVQSLVLVLDNCEHAPQETGTLIERLRGLPSVAIIATSQRPLACPQEHILAVEPFSIPDGIGFFCARAGLDEKRLDAAELGTIRTIVERVDALAIALDLAAARLTSLSLTELAAELANLRPYQLRSTRGSEPRHRTIGNVIAWSHARLEERHKRVFALAALFAGDFQQADIESLAEQDARSARTALDELVRHSLVIETEFGYRMLLPIRAVATRTLDALANRKHLDECFARRMNALASELWSEMRGGPDPALAILRLNQRYGDFCAALAWALKDPGERIDTVNDVMVAMRIIWADGGRFTEGLRWSERLESIAEHLRPATRGRVHYLGLVIAHAAGEYRRMLETGASTISAFTIASDHLGLANAYNAVAVASLNTGRFDEAEMYVDTALALYEKIGDRRGLASALVNQGNLVFDVHAETARAHAIFRSAIEIVESDGADTLVGVAIGNLAEVEYVMGEYDASETHAHAAIEQFEKVGSLPLIAWQHQTLARSALARARLATAREALHVVCDILRRSPQPMYLARLAEIAARLLAAEGRDSDAAIALAAARRLRRERQIVLMGFVARETAEDQALLAARLGEDGLAQAREAVAQWDLGQLPGLLGTLLLPPEQSTMVEARLGEDLV